MKKQEILKLAKELRQNYWDNRIGQSWNLQQEAWKEIERVCKIWNINEGFIIMDQDVFVQMSDTLLVEKVLFNE